jgi:hypothetical protein
MMGSFSQFRWRARCRLKLLVAVCADIALYAIEVTVRTSVLALSAEGETCG